MYDGVSRAEATQLSDESTAWQVLSLVRDHQLDETIEVMNPTHDLAVLEMKKTFDDVLRSYLPKSMQGGNGEFRQQYSATVMIGNLTFVLFHGVFSSSLMQHQLHCSSILFQNFDGDLIPLGLWGGGYDSGMALNSEHAFKEGTVHQGIVGALYSLNYVVYAEAYKGMFNPEANEDQPEYYINYRDPKRPYSAELDEVARIVRDM